MTRRRRVLAIGWFGENNLGDEAMLEGLLRLLHRALHDPDVTVATRDPADTAATFGTRTMRRPAPADAGFTNRELLWASLRSDLVTLGGGDLIREQADGAVPALNWLTRVRVPLRLRRPVALLGISVGDLFSPDVIDTVSDYLGRIPLVAARDTASAARLTELGARDVLTIGDLALEALDAPPPPPRPANGRPRIGVVFREILGRGRDVPETTNERLQGELGAALDRLVAGLGARVELIPFRTRGRQAATRRRRPRRRGTSHRRRRPEWTGPAIHDRARWPSSGSWRPASTSSSPCASTAPCWARPPAGPSSASRTTPRRPATSPTSACPSRRSD